MNWQSFKLHIIQVLDFYRVNILLLDKNFIPFIYSNTYHEANSYTFSNSKHARQQNHMIFVSTKKADLSQCL